MNVRFFVVGSGRSGSTWLARALGLDRSVRVWHEPLHEFDRRFAPGLGGLDRETGADACKFLARREPLMERIAAGCPRQDYAEVNGYLSFCAPELRGMFGASVIGLIRDGRYTVRSMLIRRWQREDEDSVERCCRAWAATYCALIMWGIPVFRLEALNEDYDYFCQLCERIGVEIPEENWRVMAGKRINESMARQVEEFEWTRGHTRTFRKLAGDVQEAFGYPLEAL